jgi:hypothetical protein
MFDEYVEYIKTKCRESINNASSQPDTSTVGKNIWDEGIALRFYSGFWSNNTNITLLLMDDGALRIQLYVYNIPDDKVSELNNCLDLDKLEYPNAWIESKTIRCFGFFDRDNEADIFAEIERLTKKLNRYFQLQSIKQNELDLITETA